MRRFSQIATTVILLLLTASPEARACTFSNGRSLGNGWTVTPCGGGGGGGGGGGDIDVGAAVEGAAAAVQAVGIAVNILGNVLDSVPKASLDMPTIQMPTLPSPGISMPTMPRPSVSSPSMAPAARQQPVRSPDDTAASCARMAKIYKTSHAKMVTATQHLDNVDDNHPDKLCEFGRNVGLPLLQENVNAVYMARGEKCFGEADQKRLASFRKLLDDENNAIAHDCKRAFEEGTGPTTPAPPAESSSQQASALSSPHRAPTVPHVGQAVAGSNRLASRDATSNGTTLPPTLVVKGMQTGQQGTDGPQGANQPLHSAEAANYPQGTCSDITGTGGGGGPVNCMRSNNGAPNLQAQLNSARPGPYTLSPGSAASNTAALDEFNRMRAAAIAARDAGDALTAAADWAAASAARDQLHAAGLQLCPSKAPEDYWKDKGGDNEEYCRSANCVERETAFYGMMCFPETPTVHAPLPSLAEREAICHKAFAQLKPRAPNDDWLADRMASGDVPCHANGDPFTLREILKEKLSKS